MQKETQVSGRGEASRPSGSDAAESDLVKTEPPQSNEGLPGQRADEAQRAGRVPPEQQDLVKTEPPGD